MRKFLTWEIVLVTASPQFRWFSRRTHRTQYTVMLTAKVYDTERITKHNQPRATVHGKPSGGTRHRRPGPPAPCSHTGCAPFLQLGIATTRAVRSTGEAFDSVPRVSTGESSWSHPLPSTYQYSRLSEGKQVWHEPHWFYRQFRESEPLLSFRGSFIPVQGTVYQPSPQMPAKGQPCKQVLLRAAVSGLLGQPFYTVPTTIFPVYIHPRYSWLCLPVGIQKLFYTKENSKEQEVISLTRHGLNFWILL